MEIRTCTAFEGPRCIAAGLLPEVVKRVKKVLDDGSKQAIFIFDDSTSEPIEIDFRGTVKEVLQRLETDSGNALIGNDEPQRGPGRPKLGVVSREVSLLPRHWDWLNAQPGGASVALRKLVEEARRLNRGRDQIRRSQEVAYRFMSAMAGNLAGFEEAIRALFAGNAENFNRFIGEWPDDIRAYARKLSAEAFPSQ